MTSLQRLKKQLEKVEKQLEKHRNNVADFSLSCPRTQKRWKAERNWDYYAVRKYDLLKEIEELEKNGDI
jgi:hypothetical protein